MTTPDPSPRPHLVGQPADPDQDDVRADVRYPAPGYPHDDGSPLAIWQRQATDYAAEQRERAAARRLVSLAAQAEAWKDAEHNVFLADCERALQRARAEAELAAARVPRLVDPREVPPGAPVVGDRPRHAAPDRPEDVEDVDQDDEPPASLADAAAALFKVNPGVSRTALQTILQCNSYEAKKLHAARPGADR